jgi:hypothetical protein
MGVSRECFETSAADDAGRQPQMAQIASPQMTQIGADHKTVELE